MFRKCYSNLKLCNDCDIFDLNIKKDDILMVVIKQTDNHHSHSICICNNYIFDSNTSNALPFTEEGINCCCGEFDNFIGIVNGYHLATIKKY